MANASLYSILGGLGQGENEYLAEDPWFRAGVGLQQAPQPAYTNNRDAILLPILMGLGSGAMQGYGRASAQQAAGQDYGQLYKSLTGEAYNPMEEMGPVADPEYYGQMLEEGPKPKSIDTMRGEILMEVLNKQAKQEFATKMAEQKQDFINKYGPEAIAAQAKLKGEEARAEAQGKQDVEGVNGFPLKDLPPTVAYDLAKSKGVIDEANQIANALDASGKSWADLKTSQVFSGLDKDGIALSLKNLADRLARARTGAAINVTEQKLYEDLVGGDLTADPKQVANLLRKLAQAESRMGNSMVSFFESTKKGGLGSVFNQPNTLPSQIGENNSIPPGMKLQRNPRTGATRIVPQ